MHEIGEKNKGYNRAVEITGVEDAGNQWHIIGLGLIHNGKSYDWWQTWIPKSVCNITYHHKIGKNRQKNQAFIPKWLYKKLNIYHISEEEYNKIREKSAKIEFTNAMEE